MLEQDRINASQRFLASEGRPLDDRTLDALGINLPTLLLLVQELLSQLDTRRLGVPWLSRQVGRQRSIMIADYLIQCCDGIASAALDARLHQFERNQHHAEESRVWEAANRTAGPRPPLRNTLGHNLPSKDVALHLTGFVRAIGTIADNLGALIVGLAGLPVPLQWTTYKQAVAELTKVSGARGNPELRRLSERIMSSEQALGPANWLKWTLDLRNSLVHRGKNLTRGRVSNEAKILDANGRPIPRIVIGFPLPAEPLLSEVQTMLFLVDRPVLTEDSEFTLRGVLDSTVQLTEVIAEELRTLLLQRANGESSIEQPGREQWPSTVRPEFARFSGYQPGQLPFRIGGSVVAESVGRRILAAGLDNQIRSSWHQFDTRWQSDEIVREPGAFPG